MLTLLRTIETGLSKSFGLNLYLVLALCVWGEKQQCYIFHLSCPYFKLFWDYNVHLCGGQVVRMEESTKTSMHCQCGPKMALYLPSVAYFMITDTVMNYHSCNWNPLIVTFMCSSASALIYAMEWANVCHFLMCQFLNHCNNRIHNT